MNTGGSGITAFAESDYCMLLVEGGIRDVCVMMEKRLGVKFALFDDMGLTHYNSSSINEHHNQATYHLDSLTNIDPEQASNTGRYEGKKRLFIYAINDINNRGYFVFQDVAESQTEEIVDEINVASLAFSAYLRMFYSNAKRIKKYHIDKVYRSFFEGSIDLSYVESIYGYKLDPARLFIVVVSSIADIEPYTTDREVIRTYVNERFFQRINKEALVLIDGEKLIALIPQKNKSTGVFQREAFPPDEKNADQLRLFLEKSFPISANTGISLAHPITDIREAWREASVALSLPKLIGRDHYSVEFRQLGIMKCLFSDQFDMTKRYCLSLVSIINSYDEKYSSELMQTIRVLINNNFNYKKTSQKLFIHVNTLKHRVGKIEDILNINLNSTFDKMHLYMTMLIYLVLLDNKWIDEHVVQRDGREHKNEMKFNYDEENVD